MGPAKTTAKQSARRCREVETYHRLPDHLPPICLPVRAGTAEGFREWYRSREQRKDGAISHLGDRISIDLGPGLVCLTIPTSATTLDGFRAWATSDEFPRQGRISFLGDEIFIDMSPEELETHNKVKTAVTVRLGTLCDELDLGEFYSDRTLLSNDKGGLSYEPDAIFVRWKTFESGRVELVSWTEEEGRFLELHGTPDWVMEIVSRSNMLKDTVEKRDRNYRAGIPEYWLIDAMDEDIAFQLLTRRRSGYVAVTPRGGWYKSRVFPASFRLERERNRLGRWKYQLLVKRT